MLITELFYPQVSARVGSYSFQTGVQVEIHSARDACYDWAKIRFTEQFQDKISIGSGTPAAIELGYNNVYDDTFTGYVAQPYSAGQGADEIVLKDDMLRLERVQINNTFLDTTPQEMILYILTKAGITNASLSMQIYPARGRVPLCGLNGIEAISAINAMWGLHHRFFFSGGVFHWGTKPQQDKIYSFQYGVNTLALSRTAGAWELETVSAPFVRHSQQIEVIHPKVTGIFEVSRVVFLTNDAGFIRTYIYF